MRKSVSAALVVAFFVGGCTPVAVVGGLAVTAAGAYCAGVSEVGKEITRDAVTAGQQLIVCERPEAHGSE